jgi:hypothetical protein
MAVMPAIQHRAALGQQNRGASIEPHELESHQVGPCDSLILRSGVVKFRFVLGRLSLDPPLHVKCERAADLPDGNESLEVTACRGIPSLHYRLHNSQRRLAVDVTHAEHVRCVSQIDEDHQAERLEIDQPASGPVRLRFEITNQATGEIQRDQFTVTSLVHLQAQYPSIYRRHVAPLCAVLMEGTPPVCQANDLITALRNADDGPSAVYSQVCELVESLRSADRQIRNEAEQKLIGLGLPVLSVLDGLPTTDLETEQRLRLDRVRESITPASNDTPAQLAQWLASDIQFWNSVADNLSVAQLSSLDGAVLGMTGQSLRPEIRVADASTVR